MEAGALAFIQEGRFVQQKASSEKCTWHLVDEVKEEIAKEKHPVLIGAPKSIIK
jgi:hypothetical protein